MYKALATAALAGIASAAVAPPPYQSTSVCTETSTMIWQSTTLYSTYEITHTLDESSGYAAPTSSSVKSTSEATIPGGYGSSSSDKSSSMATVPGSYGSSSEATPTSYPAETSPASPESPSVPTSVCTARTSTLIYRSTTLYSTYPVVPTSYFTDVTTVYTTTCPASSVYTSDSSEMTSYYTATSTLTSTYQTTVTGYQSATASSPTSPDTTPVVPVPYESSPAQSSPASPETTVPAPAPEYPSAGSSPASPATTGGAAPPEYSAAESSPASPVGTDEAPPPNAPYNGASSWGSDETSTTEAAPIGSYIISPGPYTSATSLPPVVPYPVPSGNATYPTASTGLPTAASSGYPVQQTGAGAVAKPLGALLGLAGLAAALL